MIMLGIVVKVLCGDPLAARSLASQGQKTVVSERAMVGGSCPNVACLQQERQWFP